VSSRQVLSAVLAFCALALPSAPVAAADARSPLNPQPQADDLLLPMPCGLSMALRRVVVPVKAAPNKSNWLADAPVTVGEDADNGLAYAEATRDAYLAGGFRSADPAERAASYYYIGKYEVTATQWRAVTSLGEPNAVCPTPVEQEPPASGTSWFDAVGFADRLTGWLYATLDKLPADAVELRRMLQLNGHVRLPTEEEWEFAARGGSLAGKNFRNPTYVEPSEPLELHVWFAGEKSANGQLRPIGLKRPNPLGLHDVLGNVAEIALEPYRMTKIGRLHGQAGGFVVKGGSFLVPDTAISAAWRKEYPHYDLDKRGPSRSETNGLRVVFVPTVETKTDPQRQRAFRAEHDELGRLSDLAAQPAAAPAEDPIDRLKSLASGGNLDADTQRRLGELTREISGGNAIRNEQRDRAANALIRIGAFYGREVNTDQIYVENQTRLWIDLKKRAAADKDIQEAVDQAYGWIQRRREDMVNYREFVKQATQDYSAETLSGQHEALAAQAENPALKRFMRFMAIFMKHSEQLRRNARIDEQSWLEDLQKR
jgi:formylglycine-generating enzyme required for sulfatase activity